ncbi:hypothetical protein Sste5346_007914 [Sporothrix stenoceras]|uniref:Aldehyde dehydrogenase domain-containing protein n=1 Tax=Sporothrix stenoceras TaxID=5173 RepID=A0ABR3YTA5_9PEZI
MSDTVDAAALRRIRTAAIDGQAHNPVFRKTQLAKLHAALLKHSDDLQQEMLADGDSAGVRPTEVAVEYSLALQIVADHYAALDPVQALKDEYAVARGQDAPESRTPVGIVVIEMAADRSPHTFVYSLLSALVPALSSGNCVVVHTPQTLLQTPRQLFHVLETALDANIFYASMAPSVPTEAAFGHRHVRVLQGCLPSTYSLSASSLPPVVSHPSRVVAIVERDADVKTAATALVRARFSFGGRSPYAPDVVLVSEWVKKDFLACAAQAAAQFMAEGGVEAGSNGTTKRKTPNKKMDSLSTRLQNDQSARIITLGSNGTVASIEDRSSFILQTKINEPVLAVVAITSVDDAIDFSKSLGGRPLSAAFVFTVSAPTAKYIGQFVDADLVIVNQLPGSLLLGPVAPAGHGISPPWTDRYTTDIFSLPRPQFISTPKKAPLVDLFLSGGTARQLQELQNKASAALIPFQRPAKAAYVGFFEQGIITGGLLLLSSVATGTGLLCYYGYKHVRS